MILIDTNFILTCLKQKIDLFSQFEVLLPGDEIVTLKSVIQELENLKNDKDLLIGCVSGAILKEDYLDLLKQAGFKEIIIHKEIPAFLPDYGLSITFSAVK